MERSVAWVSAVLSIGLKGKYVIYTQEEGVDDLIHDEGEELPEVEDVARRYEREHASFRQQNEEMDAEQLERYVQERFGNDREYGDVADGTVTGESLPLLTSYWRPTLLMAFCCQGHLL